MAGQPALRALAAPSQPRGLSGSQLGVLGGKRPSEAAGCGRALPFPLRLPATRGPSGELCAVPFHVRAPQVPRARRRGHGRSRADTLPVPWRRELRAARENRDSGRAVLSGSSAAGSGGCIGMEALCWGARVAGLMFGSPGAEGEQGRDGGWSPGHGVPPRGRDRAFFSVLKVSVKFSSLQGCVSFCSAAKWSGDTHTAILFQILFHYGLSRLLNTVPYAI